MGKGDVMTVADWAPPHVRPYVEAVIAAIKDDPRVVGLTAGGSAVTGTMDEFSDLDLVVICRDEHQPELLAGAPAFAAGLGPLLACFTGEHVGEPRLLIALYGPPPVHVDLKFVADSQLDQRVENGLILWQRDGALDAALRRATPAWPQPDPQWIEDRFWVWVHYGAAKLGRGELFECLDMLAAVRAMYSDHSSRAAAGIVPPGCGAWSRWRPAWYRRWRRRSATTLHTAAPPRCARRSPCTASCAATPLRWCAAPAQRPRAWTTLLRSRRGCQSLAIGSHARRRQRGPVSPWTGDTRFTGHSVRAGLRTRGRRMRRSGRQR